MTRLRPPATLLLALSVTACADDAAGTADTDASSGGQETTSGDGPQPTTAPETSASSGGGESGSGSTSDGLTTSSTTRTDPSSSSGTGDPPDDGLVIGGDDADYATFTEAIDDWADQTVPEGGLTFLVTPGEYPERIVVPPFDGASEASPVTFRDNGGVVTLTGEGTAAGGEAMVEFAGSDWVSFEGVGVRDDSDAVEYGFLLTGTVEDGAQHDVVRDASIMLRNDASTRGILVNCPSTLTGGEASTCSFNRFENLQLDAMGSGIQVLGPRNDDLFQTFIYDLPAQQNAIVDCVFGGRSGLGHAQSASGFGINMSNNEGAEVTGNHFVELSITDSAPAFPAGLSAISLDAVDGLVERNRIDSVSWSGAGGSSVVGIRASITPTGTLQVVNNFVSGLTRGTDFVASGGDNSLYVRGIWVFKCFDCDDVSSQAVIEHNTVSVELQAERSYPVAAFQLAGGSSGQVDTRLRNNILLVDGASNVATGRAFAVVDGNTAREYLDSDHNVIFASGPGGILGVVGQELGGPSLEATSLAQWQMISEGDANSQSLAVEFADADTGDLHLAGTSAAEMLLMMPATTVEVDIDDEARPDPTFAGADEP